MIVRRSRKTLFKLYLPAPAAMQDPATMPQQLVRFHPRIRTTKSHPALLPQAICPGLICPAQA
eukprot:6575573-Alexandrium_andersonii.AAC.1